MSKILNFIRRPVRYTYWNLNLYLIGTCIVLFILTMISPQTVNFYLGLYPPAVIQNHFYWQFLTYMFMHGGISHLFFNMLALFFLLFFYGNCGRSFFVSDLLADGAKRSAGRSLGGDFRRPARLRHLLSRRADFSLRRYSDSCLCADCHLCRNRNSVDGVGLQRCAHDPSGRFRFRLDLPLAADAHQSAARHHRHL